VREGSQGNLERHSKLYIGNWVANGEACRLIENVFAENHLRSPPFLLMAGLQIEIQGNQIALMRNIGAYYQTALP
jgi:hypothetical protein